MSMDKKQNAKTAKERDKIRTSKEKYRKPKKMKNTNVQRKIPKSVQDTIPYEEIVSEYVMRIAKNRYSKTYLIDDINYSSATDKEQEEMLLNYVDLLNGFDTTADVQVTIHNNRINKKDFERRILLKEKNDNHNELRREFNQILHEKLMLGQNGIQCKKYITITVTAVDLETANQRFLNYEVHLNSCLKRLGTTGSPLKANDRVRILTDIFRDVNKEITPITASEFRRGAEKSLCCPDYFEFKKDYFMFDEKFARCIYFRQLPATMRDEIFKEIVETNLSLIITKNISFVEPEEALKLVRRQITGMKAEKIAKQKTAAQHGTFIDVTEGTSLEKNMQEAEELLEDLQSRNQKMTLCQFVIMLTAGSFAELEQNTEKVEIVCRKFQITPSRAPYSQEDCLASVLPLGNSRLEMRRTLNSEATAVFMPFNARELTHQGGLYYGLNQITNNIIIFDRRKLPNPNGFILGVPGSGKSFAAKNEMNNSILGTDDDILIVDPEREYTNLARAYGGEVIYISENSETHINPLDLTKNPDPSDTKYDPIKAKFDFFLSFFSTIMGNTDLTPGQKTIIDICLREVYKISGITYDREKTPTLEDYYDVLKKYSEDKKDREALNLLKTLELYVHGSLNIFSNRTNVDINSRIVVYDIKELGSNLKPLGMMIVLENLWDKVAKNRSRGIGTRIYVDEMYLLFKNEQSADFFYELYKRARKWGGIPTGITQNVEDLLRSEKARSMLANTLFVLMLAQNATDREKLSELLNISPETMLYVTGATPGTGLLYAGQYGTIPFKNDFPRETNLYKMMTTAFGEEKKAEKRSQKKE